MAWRDIAPVRDEFGGRQEVLEALVDGTIEAQLILVVGGPGLEHHGHTDASDVRVAVGGWRCG
eukprot:55832-Eustigmatos_ZCMA.PRE.1